MAGYSSTPLAKKLGIKPGSTVAVLDDPGHFHEIVEPPPDVRFRTSLRGHSDLVVAFFSRRRPLERRMEALARAIHPSGGLWICWPKRTSSIPSEITETDVRAIGLAAGIVDIKVCAVDDDWSGLRFAHRVANR